MSQSVVGDRQKVEVLRVANSEPEIETLVQVLQCVGVLPRTAEGNAQRIEIIRRVGSDCDGHPREPGRLSRRGIFGFEVEPAPGVAVQNECEVLVRRLVFRVQPVITRKSLIASASRPCAASAAPRIMSASESSGLKRRRTEASARASFSLASGSIT